MTIFYKNMYCNKHMLCLGDCPKTFKSLTYNHLGINAFEFLKYFFLSSDERNVQFKINEICHNIRATLVADTYNVQ